MIEDLERNPPGNPSAFKHYFGVFAFLLNAILCIGFLLYYIFHHDGRLIFGAIVTAFNAIICALAMRRRPWPLASRRFTYERTLQNGKEANIEILLQWPVAMDSDSLFQTIKITAQAGLSKYLDTTSDPITYNSVKQAVFHSILRDIKEREIEVLRIKVISLKIAAEEPPAKQFPGVYIGRG